MQWNGSKGFTFENGGPVSGALGRLNRAESRMNLQMGRLDARGLTNTGAMMKIQLLFWLNRNQFLGVICHSILLYQRNCPKAAT
jgi:hypothetical protein